MRRARSVGPAPTPRGTASPIVPKRRVRVVPLPATSRALRDPRGHLADREASASAPRNPGANAVVTKTLDEPLDVFGAAARQDMKDDQVEVSRQGEVLELVAGKEIAQPLGEHAPPRSSRVPSDLPPSRWGQRGRPGPPALWAALETAEATESDGVGVLHPRYNSMDRFKDRRMRAATRPPMTSRAQLDLRG